MPAVLDPRTSHPGVTIPVQVIDPRVRTDGTGGSPESRWSRADGARRPGYRVKEESVTMLRTRNLLTTLVMLAGVGLALAAAPAARAGMIPNKVTVTPGNDGNYR